MVSLEIILKAFEDASKVERTTCDISLSFDKTNSAGKYRKISKERNLFVLAKNEIENKAKKGYSLQQVSVGLRSIIDPLCIMILRRDDDDSYSFERTSEYGNPEKCRVSCSDKNTCRAFYQDLRAEKP
jgi:hypothetical protein